MPYLNFDSFQMYYQQIPNCMPADTLLIHGNFATNRWWDLCREVWAERYGSSGQPGDLILAEWRGCGHSRPLREPADLDCAKFADHYLTLLAERTERPVNVIGHSTGGLIAMFAMIKAPKRFNKAVLLDPVSAAGLRFEGERQKHFLQMRQDRKICAKGIEVALGKVDLRSSFFQDIVDDAFSIDPIIPKYLLHVLDKVDIVQEVTHLPHEILILHGEDDPVLASEDSKKLATVLQHAHCELIPACGHSPNLECPRYFVNRVNKFLFPAPANSNQPPKASPTGNGRLSQPHRQPARGSIHNRGGIKGLRNLPRIHDSKPAR
jgi:pimeloyl-ACP methyl ester carboxylesterase